MNLKDIDERYWNAVDSRPADQGNMQLHPDIAAALGIKQEGETK